MNNQCRLLLLSQSLLLSLLLCYYYCYHCFLKSLLDPSSIHESEKEKRTGAYRQAHIKVYTYADIGHISSINFLPRISRLFLTVSRIYFAFSSCPRRWLDFRLVSQAVYRHHGNSIVRVLQGVHVFESGRWPRTPLNIS